MIKINKGMEFHVYEPDTSLLLQVDLHQDGNICIQMIRQEIPDGKPLRASPVVIAYNLKEFIEKIKKDEWLLKGL